jgi:hypothetical protein
MFWMVLDGYFNRKHGVFIFSNDEDVPEFFLSMLVGLSVEDLLQPFHCLVAESVWIGTLC